MEDMNNNYSYGWTVVKVSPKQITGMYLDPEFRFLEQRENHTPYDNSNRASSDLIVKLVSKTGLEFLEKFVEKDGTHVYIFVNSSSFFIDIKFGWVVLSFFHKHKAHVSGVIANHGQHTLHNLDVFYVDPSLKKFYHASIYPSNEVESYLHILNSPEFIKIEDDLTPHVEGIIKNKYIDKVIEWLYES